MTAKPWRDVPLDREGEAYRQAAAELEAELADVSLPTFGGEPRLLTAWVPDLGRYVLVTLWPDGGGEVAFRATALHTWSPPTELGDAP